MRLPDFLIIGAAKSGTTTLHRHLSEHPSVFMPAEKEPDFFGSQYQRGLQWYSSLFENAQYAQICGESSTDYTKYPRFPECPERISNVIPNAKLIYMMRNPVDRVFSHYIHLNREVRQPPSFESYLESNPNILSSSRYMMQIERYLAFFPSSSFLFLLLDDYEKDHEAFLGRVNSFLGIPENVSSPQKIVSNSSDRFRQLTIRAAVVAPLKKVPAARKVAASLPRSFRDAAYQMLSKSFYGRRIQEAYAVAPMRPETRQRLVEAFQSDNSDLAQFLKVDLSHWNRA